MMASEDALPLFEQLTPAAGILKMKRIRLWIAVIIITTVVGALFLVTSNKIHNQSRAYMLGQYRVKDTKVGAALHSARVKSELSVLKRQCVRYREMQ